MSAGPDDVASAQGLVEADTLSTGVMVGLLLLWVTLGHRVAAKSEYVGEGSMACLLGLCCGFIILFLRLVKSIPSSLLARLLAFNTSAFFTFLLPPIIFYAGLSVRKKRIWQNAGSIAMFGVVGTFVSFIILSIMLYAVSQLTGNLSLEDCLALGAIFSATDSVAVLQVLHRERTPLLYSLVFGEGVLNDATSIVLLKSVQDLAKQQDVDAAAAVDIVGRFVYLSVTSVLLGIAAGLTTALLLRQFPVRETPQEVALVGLAAYSCYLSAELLGLSGILTLFCCAMVLSHYALHNISPLGNLTTIEAFKTLSYVSEGALFLFVGMDALDPGIWSNTQAGEVVLMFVVLTALMIASRAAFVFPISWLHNLVSSEQLDRSSQMVIWWAGLMRGAVSIALVYYFFDPLGTPSDRHRSTLISTTLLLVIFTTLVFGAATKPMLKALGEDAGAAQPSCNGDGESSTRQRLVDTPVAGRGRPQAWSLLPASEPGSPPPPHRVAGADVQQLLRVGAASAAVPKPSPHSGVPAGRLWKTMDANFMGMLRQPAGDAERADSVTATPLPSKLCPAWLDASAPAQAAAGAGPSSGTSSPSLAQDGGSPGGSRKPGADVETGALSAEQGSGQACLVHGATPPRRAASADGALRPQGLPPQLLAALLTPAMAVAPMAAESAPAAGNSARGMADASAFAARSQEAAAASEPRRGPAERSAPRAVPAAGSTVAEGTPAAVGGTEIELEPESWHEAWEKFDRTVMQPVFGGPNTARRHPHAEELSQDADAQQRISPRW